MGVRTRVSITRDKGVWQSMKANLRRGTSQSTQVGWWDSQYPDGTSVAQVAQWNEEGHMNGGWFPGTITPPRPFIRLGFLPDIRKSNLIGRYSIHIDSIARGKMSWNRLHELLGEDLKRMLQEQILDWKSPSNSAATVSIKGFNDPLIDTGLMYDTIKIRTAPRRRK